jgi:glucose/arabinose dehydrogenase
MSKLRKILLTLLVVLILLAGLGYWLTRGHTAELPVQEVTGGDPTLAEPQAESIPTVQIAEPVGWGESEVPVAAAGLEVKRFAEGLDHPRVLHRLPNGDVLVTLTRAPKLDSEAGGIMDKVKDWIAGWLMSEAGAGGKSPDQLLLLRDADGDGTAEVRQVLRDDLASPSGIAWQDGTLYVANHNALLAFDYALGTAKVTGTPRKLMDLAPGTGHWMRNIEINPDGTKLYVAVGSHSNVGEAGMEIEQGRAMIWEFDLAGGTARPYGAGMRNPNGLDFNPSSGELWTTVNERDMLGSDLVPDYLSNVPVGVQYGWPWLYWGDNLDGRVDAPRPPFIVEYTRRPEFALGPHVAALGLVFSAEGHLLGERFGRGAFIARHGSWNRKPPSGYDVIYVAFDERGNPLGKPVPVLTGFLQDDGTTRGRPTWVEWGGDGSLLVSDDTAGIIWRVVATGAKPAPAIARNKPANIKPRVSLDGDPALRFSEDYARKSNPLGQ